MLAWSRASTLLLATVAVVAGFTVWSFRRPAPGKPAASTPARISADSGGFTHLQSLADYRISTLTYLAHEYAHFHGERLPPADKWEEALRPYAAKHKKNMAELVLSPLEPKPRRFAMNKALSNRRVRVPQDITSDEYSHLILFFESTRTNSNASDNITSIPSSGDRTCISVLGGGANWFYGSGQESFPGMEASALAAAIERSHQIEQAITARQQRRLQ